MPPPRGGRNLPYSIDLMYRPCNSVSTNVLYTVILNERHLGQRDLQNTKHVSHHTVKSNGSLMAVFRKLQKCLNYRRESSTDRSIVSVARRYA